MGCGRWVDKAIVEEELQAAHGITIATAMIKQQAAAVEKAKSEHQGVTFLMGSSKQYNPLHKKLANTFVIG